MGKNQLTLYPLSATLHDLPFCLSSEQMALIEQRLAEFAAMKQRDTYAWFNELCFCILTANAQARKALAIEAQVGSTGFLTKSQEELTEIIRSHKHRFHNNKARYIILARPYSNIKHRLEGLTTGQARTYLVTHIKGIGYKEASHFLRNVGYNDCAIIDRHIIRFLVNEKFIPHTPKTVTPKLYNELELLLTRFNLPLSMLDLMIWCFMTGAILK